MKTRRTPPILVPDTLEIGLPWPRLHPISRTWMQVLRVLRALRLMRLAKLLSASRLLQHWETQLVISYGAIMLFKAR